MNVLEGLQQAHSIKAMECSHKTMLDYKSYINNIKGYLIKKEKMEILLTDFGKREAMLYLDYLLIEKKHEAVTRNNNLRAMKVMFNVLLYREYITDNPFVGIKFLKNKQKRRKVFTKVETKIIMNYLKTNDLDLLLAISFCYYCALRRTEMRKLKIENIDLTKGLILLDGNQTKNKELGSITMTQHFLDYLTEIRIKKYPAHFYVFGKGLKPGVLPCNQNSIPDRHRAMIKKLKKFAILQEVEGKTFYSWKDTAARDMIEEGLSAPALQKHFRHSSLETTQRYLESFGYCNDSIRDLKSKLF